MNEMTKAAMAINAMMITRTNIVQKSLFSRQRARKLGGIFHLIGSGDTVDDVVGDDVVGDDIVGDDVVGTACVVGVVGDVGVAGVAGVVCDDVVGIAGVAGVA